MEGGGSRCPLTTGPASRPCRSTCPRSGCSSDLSKTGLADDALRKHPLVTGAFPAAFAAMDALEKGAIANPDEKRRVGHYWLRAPERAPDAGDRRGDPRDARAHRGLRRRGPRRPRRAAEGAALHEPPRRRHRRLGARAAVRRGRARLAARPAEAVLLRQHGPRRHGARALAHRGDRGRPPRDAHGRDLEVGRHEGDAQRDARRERTRTARAGLDFAKHAVAVTGRAQRARRDGRAGRLARALPDVGLGRRADVGALRRRPPARGAPGPRHPGDARRARRPATRRRASPTSRRTPPRCSRSRGTTRRAAAARRTWSSSRTRTGSSSSRATSSSSSWSRSARRRTSTGRVVNQGIAVYGNKGSTDQHAYVQQLREGVAELLRDVPRGREGPRGRRALARGRARRHARRLPARLPPRDAEGARRERPRLDHAHGAGRLGADDRRPHRALRAGGRPLRAARRDQRVPPAGRRGGQEGRHRRPRAAGAGSSRT